jgi:hypothetical protein
MAKCSCDAKKTFSSLKEQLEHEHQMEKAKALKALEDRVWRPVHIHLVAHQLLLTHYLASVRCSHYNRFVRRKPATIFQEMLPCSPVQHDKKSKHWDWGTPARSDKKFFQHL